MLSPGLGHLQHSKPSKVRGALRPRDPRGGGEGERGRAPQAGAQSSPRTFCNLRPLSSHHWWIPASSVWPEVLSVEQSKHVLYILKASFQQKRKKMGFSKGEGGKKEHEPHVASCRSY